MIEESPLSGKDEEGSDDRIDELVNGVADLGPRTQLVIVALIGQHWAGRLESTLSTDDMGDSLDMAQVLLRMLQVTLLTNVTQRLVDAAEAMERYLETGVTLNGMQEDDPHCGCVACQARRNAESN